VPLHTALAPHVPLVLTMEQRKPLKIPLLVQELARRIIACPNKVFEHAVLVSAVPVGGSPSCRDRAQSQPVIKVSHVGKNRVNV